MPARLIAKAVTLLEPQPSVCYRTDDPNEAFMKRYTAVVERDSETGLYVGHVPGFPGAHSQGGTLDELNRNLREVIAMLLEDGEPSLETEFVGIQTVQID
jgi:predicted RNase H-like HicB family nuclease